MAIYCINIWPSCAIRIHCNFSNGFDCPLICLLALGCRYRLASILFGKPDVRISKVLYQYTVFTSHLVKSNCLLECCREAINGGMLLFQVTNRQRATLAYNLHIAVFPRLFPKSHYWRKVKMAILKIYLSITILIQ